MKILMVNKFLYPRGGSESYMLSLGEELSRRGHTVEYFGMYDEKNTVGNTAGAYTGNMDFHGTGLSRFLYPFRILYSFEAKKKILRAIDAFGPDVVHMNNINFQLTPSIVDGAKKRKIPVVQTVHDYQMICPNHLFYNFDKNEPCEKCSKGVYGACIQNKCIHGSKVKSILGVMEAKLHAFLGSYKKVDLYVCPSHFLENKLLSARSFYKGKTKTIHNFINKKAFCHTGEETEDYILYVGRLSKEKGVELLAAAAKLLPQYTFKVAGGGPDAAALENVPNVELLGFIGGKDLTSLLSKAKILLLPSVCYENCPLSILEAHCVGIPVVTMNSGGMAELVQDTKTGTLVNKPTPECLAEAIQKTLENEEYYETLKENCRKEKDSILSVETYTDALVKAYEELIAR